MSSSSVNKLEEIIVFPDGTRETVTVVRRSNESSETYYTRAYKDLYKKQADACMKKLNLVHSLLMKCEARVDALAQGRSMCGIKSRSVAPAPKSVAPAPKKHAPLDMGGIYEREYGTPN